MMGGGPCGLVGWLVQLLCCISFAERIPATSTHFIHVSHYHYATTNTTTTQRNRWMVPVHSSHYKGHLYYLGSSHGCTCTWLDWTVLSRSQLECTLQTTGKHLNVIYALSLSFSFSFSFMCLYCSYGAWWHVSLSIGHWQEKSITQHVQVQKARCSLYKHTMNRPSWRHLFRDHTSCNTPVTKW